MWITRQASLEDEPDALVSQVPRPGPRTGENEPPPAGRRSSRKLTASFREPEIGRITAVSEIERLTGSSAWWQASPVSAARGGVAPLPLGEAAAPDAAPGAQPTPTPRATTAEVAAASTWIPRRLIDARTTLRSRSCWPGGWLR